MENQPERISDDELRVRAEGQGGESAAGARGAEGSNEELDPAERAVREGGGGEAEGFEDAEDKLVENAGHGEGNPLPAEVSGETESDLSGAEYGEADEADPKDAA